MAPLSTKPLRDRYLLLSEAICNSAAPPAKKFMYDPGDPVVFRDLVGAMAPIHRGNTPLVFCRYLDTVNPSLADQRWIRLAVRKLNVSRPDCLVSMLSDDDLSVQNVPAEAGTLRRLNLDDLLE